MGAEGAVNCLGYWLASAFTGNNKTAWYYQYSVPFALHATDLAAYYGPPTENQGPDLVTAFRSTSSRNHSLTERRLTVGKEYTAISSLLATLLSPAKSRMAFPREQKNKWNIQQATGLHGTTKSP